MVKKRPTQMDVARAAGVSRATVSYVLNNQTDQRIPISPETRQRVLETIAMLGYQIDARAQALRSGETRTIGVLLPLYENPFFWELLRGISDEAQAAGYSLLLTHNPLTPELEVQSVREMAEQRVDGLVMIIGFKLVPEAVLAQLRHSHRPVVEISCCPSQFDYVQQDYLQAALALMQHLLDLGHRRIGFLQGVTTPSQGVDRLQAYRIALEQAGLPHDESLLVQCGEHLADGYQAAYGILSRPDRPTALMTINDLLSIAALRAAADLGLRVPHDLSIAGFDDIPFAEYTIPRLTSISTQPVETGREAVRMLLKRIANPDAEQYSALSPWQLRIRESTGRAPE
jgi:LacI family transcriptional regulator